MITFSCTYITPLPCLPDLWQHLDHTPGILIMARRILDVLAFAGYFGYAWGNSCAIAVSGAPPTNTSAPIPESFVSYSIEFVYFPDFAGMIPQSSVI